MKIRGELNPIAAGVSGVRWEIAENPVDYDTALARMAQEADAIRQGGADELVWLLEHPPLYTAGTSAKPSDLLLPRFPVHETGRGGQYTYHGPGQRIAYTMLDVRARGNDVRVFVAALEEWIIKTLQQFGIEGERREDRVGVWVRGLKGEAKIAALGIRIRQGVSLHGISLNVDPDLSHYDGIVACGVRDHGVTSLRALGVNAGMPEVDRALKESFDAVFQQASVN